MPARILILYAHPAPHKSRVQRKLAEAARAMDGVTFHDLYDAYPDFDIDVPAEQRRLLDHDIFVFQHPLYWYSTPALLKQWEDLVLEHGWAYGSRGVALRGRRWMHVVTAGGRESVYRADGPNRFTVAEFLRPLEQTARLCGVEWLPPFVIHGTHAMTAEEIGRAAGDYRRRLEALRDGIADRARPVTSDAVDPPATPGGRDGGG